VHVLLLVVAVPLAQVVEVVDAGLAEAPAAPVAAAMPTPPPPPPPGFDVAATPWGPGRKSSGEFFSSAATPLDEGPLRWRWGQTSLAVGLQYLARAELRNDADFTPTAKDFTAGVDHRARVSARVAAFGRAGALLELQDVRGFGTEPSTAALLAATGVHQAFVDLKATTWLDVRLGRQELAYGEDRLVGSLDWAMSARAFDGLFVRATPGEGFTVDAFGMVVKTPAFLTDSSGGRFQNSGTWFTGAVGRWRRGKAGVDLAALALLEDPSTSATGFRPDHNRLTFDARGVLPLGPVLVVGEGVFQVGTTTAKERVLAGAFAARATYTLPNSGFYVMAEGLGASGDGTPGDGVDSSFNQLFPTGHAHLGYLDYVAWQNVVAARGTAGYKSSWGHLWLDVHHFRAWDPRGAWWTAGGAQFVAADPARADGVLGNELDLSATLPLTPMMSIAGAFGLFLPGGMAAVQPSGVGRGTSPSTWGFLSLRAQL
jgi:hypothetical protein